MADSDEEKGLLNTKQTSYSFAGNTYNTNEANMPDSVKFAGSLARSAEALDKEGVKKLEKISQHSIFKDKEDLSEWKRFPDDNSISKWNDKWAVIVFIIHIFITLLLGAIGGVIAIVQNSTNETALETYDDVYGTEDVYTIFVEGLTIEGFFLVLTSLIICAMFGILFSAIWLVFSKFTPQIMLYANIGACIVLTVITCGAFGVYGYLSANYILILTAGGLGFFNFIYVSSFFAQGHLKQSADLLHVTFEFLQNHRDLYKACIIGLVTAFVWMIVWASCFLLSQQLIYINAYIIIPVFAYFLFSWYWSVHVIKNVVHVTITSAVGRWYFEERNQNSVKDAFKQSLSSSFGSICFGSLLVAIVETVTISIDFSKQFCQGNKFIATAEDKISKNMPILLYFNRYAFSQIAIYRKPYLKSGGDTILLMSKFGLDNVLSSSVVSSVGIIGTLAAAMLTTLIAGIVTSVSGLVATMPAWIPSANMVICFLIGFAIASTVLGIIFSISCGMFICACIAPTALPVRSPPLYNVLERDYYDQCSKLFKKSSGKDTKEGDDHHDHHDHHHHEHDDHHHSSSQSRFEISSSSSSSSSDEEEERIRHKKSKKEKKKNANHPVVDNSNYVDMNANRQFEPPSSNAYYPPGVNNYPPMANYPPVSGYPPSIPQTLDNYIAPPQVDVHHENREVNQAAEQFPAPSPSNNNENISDQIKLIEEKAKEFQDMIASLAALLTAGKLTPQQYSARVDDATREYELFLAKNS